MRFVVPAGGDLQAISIAIRPSLRQVSNNVGKLMTPSDTSQLVVSQGLRRHVQCDGVLTKTPPFGPR